MALSCGTSCDTQAQDGVSHEVVGEGPRRIIFDLENISEHEEAAGAKLLIIMQVTIAFFTKLQVTLAFCESLQAPTRW